MVKAYVKEEQALEQFSKANDGLCSINLQAQTKLAFLNPCVNMVLNLCTVGVLYVGGVTVRTGGSVTPGQAMAAITYLSLILMRIIFMANIFQTFTRAAASWKQIQEVLDTQPILQSRTASPRTEQRGKSNSTMSRLPIRTHQTALCCGIFPSGWSPGRRWPSCSGIAGSLR